MSTYDDESTGHRNALQQVSEARQEALSAVSEMRQRGPPSHPPNLAPTDKQGKPLASVATQYVADYLLQLRPYRATTSAWEVDIGAVELPEQIGRGSPDAFGEPGRRDALHICRDPMIPLRNVSQLIQAANMSVQYSTATTGETRVLPQNGTRDVTGTAADGPVRGDPNVSNAPGDTPGSNSDEVRTYNIVFPSQTLLRFLELADEVAAELNLLIEFDTPAAQDGDGF